MDISAIKTLDHIGLLGHDLDEMEKLYTRLGFRLTPQTILEKVDEGGQPVPGGISNQHIMLKTGYLELAAITHPEANNPLAERVANYQGVHILVYGISSADEAYLQLQSSGFQVQKPAIAQRELFFLDPPGLARFKWFPFPSREPSEGLLAAVEHLTFEALRTPEIIEHPNTALALDEVFVCVPDLTAAKLRYERLLGIASRKESNTVVFQFEQGRQVLMEPDALKEAFPGVTPPQLPYTAGFSIKVRELEEAKTLVQDNGLTVHEMPGEGFWLSGDEALGAVIRFHR